MPLSDKWNRAQLRTLVQNELMDPSGRWWTPLELNQYLDEWQLRLQDWFEFSWAIATASVTAVGTTTNSKGLVIPASTASILLSTFIPDALRCDAFYWTTTNPANTTNTITSTLLSPQHGWGASPWGATQWGAGTNTSFVVSTQIVVQGTQLGVRLAGRVKQDLDILIRDWRWVLPTDPPLVVYQDDINDIVLWPPPAVSGFLMAEYPVKTTTFATDTSTMIIPAWARYSASAYCAYRAYLRTGPRQDIQKAMTYKAQWMRYIYRYRRMWDNYFPDRYTQLKPKQPSDQYNISILNPPYITVIPP